MKKIMEKRYKELKIRYIKRTTPKNIFPVIFIRSCIQCKKDIRFKKMWTMEVPMYGLFMDKGLYYFGCKDCFPTKDDFFKEISKSKDINESKWLFSAKTADENIRDWAIMTKLISKEEADKYTTKELFNKIELI